MKLIVDHAWTWIEGEHPSNIILPVLSYKVEGAWFSSAYKAGHWDGREKFIEYDRSRKQYRFPSGLVSRVTTALDAANYRYSLIDERSYDPPDPCFLLLDDYGNSTIDLTKGKWSYQSRMVVDALSRGRGIISVPTGGGKCLGKGTEILLADGSKRKVEDVCVGDILHGPGSEYRKVLSISSGFGKLYQVTPVKGKSWICNEDHVLTLVETVSGRVIDISVKDFLSKSQTFQGTHKLFRTSVEFPSRSEELVVDPYFVGMWLGDGHHPGDDGFLPCVAISKPDPEVKELVYAVASSWRLEVREDDWSPCPTYRIVGKRGAGNPLLKALRSLDLFSYATASREERLQFLAGIVDSDGYVTQGSIEIVQKRQEYANLVCLVSRSLGFYVSEGEKYVSGVRYIRLRLSGDMSVIPTRIPRKKPHKRKQIKNVLRTGFSLTFVGEGEFFGFTLDGDGRFLLSDFTVTHNTEIGAALIASLKKKTVWLTHRVNLMYQAQERLEKRLGIPIGMVGDGHWNIQDVTVVMAQTAITSLQEGREDLDHFLRTCEVFIPDEAHHAESDQWYEILGRVNAPWRFGLTATPQLEGPGLALVGMVGEIVAQVSLLELIERRVLVLPRIWFISTNVPKLKGVRDARVAYKQGVVMCKERNEAICRVAEVFKMENKPCVTLVKRVAHGELLSNMMCQRGIRAEYLYGNTPKEERKGLLEKLADGRYSNIVATAELLGEGTDLPWLRAIINATGTKGGGDKANGETGRNTLQFLGRVIRSHPGKFYADYVDIVDNCHKSLLDNTRARVSTLQSEGYGPFIKYWRDYKVEI